MRSPASLFAPPIGPHRYRDAWVKLPKVVLTYVGVTAVGLGGYICFQYAMSALFPLKPAEVKPSETPPPVIMGAPPTSSAPVQPAPISDQPPIPTAASSPTPTADAIGIANRLAAVIASAQHRNETVGRIVSQDGTRLTIQMLPQRVTGQLSPPKTNEIVTLGPLYTHHDQSWTPDSDGTVNHVVYVAPPSDGKILHWLPTSESAISVPAKQLDKLVGALKILSVNDYQITVQLANPTVKREFDQAYNH